jgi:hypothetical protein
MNRIKRIKQRKPKFMSENVALPPKVKDKIVTYITEQRRLTSVIEEIVFTVRETLGLDESYVLNDVNEGFVKQASPGTPDVSVEGQIAP